MKIKLLGLAVASTLLAACGGEADDPTTRNWQIGEVYYSYPYEGQQGVSPKTPIIARFSHAVSVESGNVQLLRCDTQADTCEGATPVALGEPQALDGGLGVSIQPQQPLEFATHYRLEFSDLDTGNGIAAFPDGGMDFTTRMDADGPLSHRKQGAALVVRQLIPDGDTLPFMDFSALRLQFNQMLNTDTVRYGDTDADASIELEHQGQTVPAILLVKGNAVTVDPIEDLAAGETYTLKLTSSVRGVDDAQLTGGFEKSWQAGNSKPRATLVQEVVKASDVQEDPCNQVGALTAKLTGEAMNCVPLQSTLLGSKDATLQSGNVYAELAHLPNYPDVSPLRIARNSLLTGSNIDVKVGGDVPAGISTGDISVTFLSDASGYLLPNPYSDAHEAPKQVRLYMDVSMTAENPEANGALSQTLMHVELNGMALVQNGRMEIDAVGIVEPKILGQETAFGLLSFHMKSYEDQERAPQPVPDMTSPVLQSMTPAANDSGVADKARPGDPIILNFSEPLDPATLEQPGAVTFTHNGMEENVEWALDGATLVLHPQMPLVMGESYAVALGGQVTDLAGNPLASVNATLQMPARVGDAPAPVALTTYPGFPCASDKEHWEIEAGNHGFCLGGTTDDDRTPVPLMPADRSIHVRFSQDIDPASVIFDNSIACDVGSFRVEKVELDPATGKPMRYDEDSTRKYQCEEGVKGKLEVGTRSLVFTPAEPWEEGTYYRYVLMSVNGTSAQQPNDCSSGEAICSTAGKRLQTAVLSAPDADMGGPNMHLHFIGAPSVASVFQPLRNLPTLDINANGHFDSGEPGYGSEGRGVNTTDLFIDGYDGEGLLYDPELVCDTEEGCDIHVVGGLNTEVFGMAPYTDPVTGETGQAVRVGLYPTMIQASSVTLLVKILGFIPSETPTETQFMRMRYDCVAWPEDADNYCEKRNPDGSYVFDEIQRQGLIPGWIVETDAGPEFRTDVELFMDAPYMHIVLNGSHNLHSYPLTMNLSGPVTFLPDGRIVINQVNANAIPINVERGVLLNTPEIFLKIPEGGVVLQYLGAPLKN